MLSDNSIIENLSKRSCRHIAIIMDGNGRWAKKKGKTKFFGYKAGVESAFRAIAFATNNNISVLTLYALSNENWNRPEQEINIIIELFIKILTDELKNLYRNNIRLRIIGDVSRFNLNLQKLIYKAEKFTINNTGLTLNIAANYGGRWDIIQGVKKLAKLVQKGLLKPDQISESLLDKYTCMNDLVPVDLIIRTGGEYRISNFLLWQISYTELYFTDVLWPDFNEEDFRNALNNFFNRERRFGRTERPYK